MKLKTFAMLRLSLVIIMGALVGGFVSVGNYIIPLIAVAIASGLMFLIKKRSGRVLTDERIDKIAGSASRITYAISTVVMALTGMVFIAMREKYPQLLLSGYILSYFVMGMLVVYSVSFWHYDTKGD